MSTGRIHNTASVNAPASAKYNPTHGFHRYMPLREFVAKDPVTRELQGPAVWHDFGENKTFYAGNNWEKAPPSLPTGDPGREPRCQLPSRAYREKYAAIFGHE